MVTFQLTLLVCLPNLLIRSLTSKSGSNERFSEQRFEVRSTFAQNCWPIKLNERSIDDSNTTSRKINQIYSFQFVYFKQCDEYHLSQTKSEQNFQNKLNNNKQCGELTCKQMKIGIFRWTHILFRNCIVT